MSNKTNARIIFRANNKLILEVPVISGEANIFDLEALIQKKHEADKSEQYHYARDAMKQARGFVDDMANLSFRYKLACITKGIASPMFRNLLQKLKFTGGSCDA